MRKNFKLQGIPPGWGSEVELFSMPFERHFSVLKPRICLIAILKIIPFPVLIQKECPEHDYEVFGSSVFSTKHVAFFFKNYAHFSYNVWKQEGYGPIHFPALELVIIGQTLIIFSKFTCNYQIYGHFPKIIIRYQGTPVQPIYTQYMVIFQKLS